MRRATIAFLTIFILAGHAAWSQEGKKEVPPDEIKDPADKKKSGKKGPAKDGDDKDADSGPKESPRLQKLKTLSYDRRPSAILRAWSTPPVEPAAQTEPDKSPDKSADKAKGKDKDKKNDPLVAELAALQ